MVPITYLSLDSYPSSFHFQSTHWAGRRPADFARSRPHIQIRHHHRTTKRTNTMADDSAMEHIGDIALEIENDETADDAANINGSDKKNGKQRGGGKDKKKEELVPIEELYDLSQPIKRVSL